MKVGWMILLMIALLPSSVASAQVRTPNDLNTLLRDASYVFNRFEELSVGMSVQIDKYPVEIRNNSKGALSGVLRNVEVEKPALNAMFGQHNVSSVDLLDVYTELDEVASELDGESSSNGNWGDAKFGSDLAQLAAKIRILSANFAAKLRSRIAAQELEIMSCAQKTLSHK